MKAFKIFKYGNIITNTLNKPLLMFGSNLNICKQVLRQPEPIINYFSSWSQNMKISFLSSNINLVSFNSVIIPSRGMKVRGRLQLRCKDCYLERKDGRMYVFCKSYPRHKQMAMEKREKYTWILSHCCQSKKRPY